MPRLSFLVFSCLLLTIGCTPKPYFLNVSYDPTRELYEEYNKVFEEHWKKTTGETIKCERSNGGSGSQARKVIGGLDADVVTLALAFDIDSISKHNPELIATDWQSKFPNNSCPYYSTIVFLVRKGNPKNIRDWDDLLKEDVKIITPDPKTSGGARWNYLAAWGYVLEQELGDLSLVNNPGKKEEIDAANTKAFEFVKAIFNAQKVPVMDSGARQATNTFVQNRVGDVLLAWENEALYFLTSKEGQDLEAVYPSISILAEPPVAIVDKNVDKKGTRKVAQAYLDYLYEPAGQEICARHYYRPCNQEIAQKYGDRFGELKLFKIDDVFGGWANAQKTHFDDGGTFDQIGKK